jgi:hypothetical protein
VLTDNPIVYWRLGESVGTTAVDASGNGHTGTYVEDSGSIDYAQTGPLFGDTDTAIKLAGLSTDDPYVEAAASTDFDTANLTIECFLKKTAVEDSNFCHFAQVGGSSFTTWRWVTCLRRTTINEPFQIRSSLDTTGAITTAGSTGFTDLLWRHVAVTYDGTDWRFYLDGALFDTVSGAGAHALSTGVTNQVFRVGALGDPSSGDRWRGWIDEVALYGTALSGARIAAHYAAAI